MRLLVLMGLFDICFERLLIDILAMDPSLLIIIFLAMFKCWDYIGLIECTVFVGIF